MDAQAKSRVINEAYDYIFENWIYTEPFIEKIRQQLRCIEYKDVDLNDEDKKKLTKTRTCLFNITMSELGLFEIEMDRPWLHFNLNIKRPTFFETRQALPELPGEMQMAIFSNLPFHERLRLSIISKAWRDFFNNQVIEKEYIFPKTSGGLILFANNQKPKVLKELLFSTKKEIKEDIETELYNGMKIRNNRKIENLEKVSSDGVSAFYTLLIPALFSGLLAYYYEYDKVLYSLGVFMLLPLVFVPLTNNTLKSLKDGPENARTQTHSYFNNIEKEGVCLKK